MDRCLHLISDFVGIVIRCGKIKLMIAMRVIVHETMRAEQSFVCLTSVCHHNLHRQQNEEIQTRETSLKFKMTFFFLSQIISSESKSYLVINSKCWKWKCLRVSSILYVWAVLFYGIRISNKEKRFIHSNKQFNRKKMTNITWNMPYI